MSDKLKPCPFCGCKDVYDKNGLVNCQLCGAESGILDNEDNWNRRPIEDRQRELMKEAADELSYFASFSGCGANHPVWGLIKRLEASDE